LLCDQSSKENLCIRDDKSLLAAVMLCATLVNRLTNSFPLAILLSQSAELKSIYSIVFQRSDRTREFKFSRRSIAYMGCSNRKRPVTKLSSQSHQYASRQKSIFFWGGGKSGSLKWPGPIMRVPLGG